jgi:hypothetical protein
MYILYNQVLEVCLFLLSRDLISWRHLQCKPWLYRRLRHLSDSLGTASHTASPLFADCDGCCL